MTGQQIKLRKPIERLAIDEWNPCAHKSEKNSFDWEQLKFRPRPRRHVRQQRRNRSAVVSSRIVSTSMHSAKCRQNPANNASEDEFNLWADMWERETSLLSSPKKKAEHPAYQAIIQMGDNAIPLILDRMRSTGGHWYWALTALTGISPIPQGSHGIMSEMRDAWLAWGRERGYC